MSEQDEDLTRLTEAILEGESIDWDAELAPTTETLFRALGAHGYDVGTFVFDTGYLFKGMPEANVLGTSETLDGAIAWLRERGDRPFLLFFHSWATHMPYDIVHADRKNWLAAKQEVIGGIQSDSASALEAPTNAAVSLATPSTVEARRACGITVVTVLSTTLAPRASVIAARISSTPGPGRSAISNFSPIFSCRARILSSLSAAAPVPLPNSSAARFNSSLFQLVI